MRGALPADLAGVHVRSSSPTILKRCTRPQRPVLDRGTEVDFVLRLLAGVHQDGTVQPLREVAQVALDGSQARLVSSAPP